MNKVHDPGKDDGSYVIISLQALIFLEMVSLIYRALLPQLLTWDDPLGFKAGSQVLHTILSHKPKTEMTPNT